MKKILFILMTVTIISCQKEDNIQAETNMDDEPQQESYFSLKRIEPILGASTYTYEYRYDNEGKITALWNMRNTPEQLYAYNHNINNDLVSIEILNNLFTIDDISYRGKIDVTQYDDFIFTANLNLYDVDTDVFIETFKTYEIHFNGQLITRYISTTVDSGNVFSRTINHDNVGRLLEIIDDSTFPSVDKWISSKWTTEALPMYSVLQFRSWANWFPDKFISLYAVTEGGYENETNRIYNYAFPNEDFSEIEINHEIGSNVGRRIVTYESY